MLSFLFKLSWAIDWAAVKSLNAYNDTQKIEDNIVGQLQGGLGNFCKLNHTTERLY